MEKEQVLYNKLEKFRKDEKLFNSLLELAEIKRKLQEDCTGRIFKIIMEAQPIDGSKKKIQLKIKETSNVDFHSELLINAIEIRIDRLKEKILNLKS